MRSVWEFSTVSGPTLGCPKEGMLPRDHPAMVALDGPEARGSEACRGEGTALNTPITIYCGSVGVGVVVFCFGVFWCVLVFWCVFRFCFDFFCFLYFVFLCFVFVFGFV